MTTCQKCGKEKRVINATNQSERVNALAASVKTLATVVQRISTPTLATQVEQELLKPQNRGVGALMNEHTGKVATFMAPKPYWSQNNVTDASVESLEAEIAKLTASLDGLDSTERAKVETDIKLLERQVVEVRRGNEVARRKEERRAERKQQRYPLK